MSQKISSFRIEYCVPLLRYNQMYDAMKYVAQNYDV